MVWVLPMILPGQLHRMLPYPVCIGFVSYPPLPDVCLDTVEVCNRIIHEYEKDGQCMVDSL